LHPSSCFWQTGREILQLQQAVGGAAMKEKALLNEAAATLLGIKLIAHLRGRDEKDRWVPFKGSG
jgi:hypothetical protein